MATKKMGLIPCVLLALSLQSVLGDTNETCGTDEVWTLGYLPEISCLDLNPTSNRTETGCFCRDYYVRDSNGTCIPMLQCPVFAWLQLDWITKLIISDHGSAGHSLDRRQAGPEPTTGEPPAGEPTPDDPSTEPPTEAPTTPTSEAPTTPTTETSTTPTTAAPASSTTAAPASSTTEASTTPTTETPTTPLTAAPTTAAPTAAPTQSHTPHKKHNQYPYDYAYGYDDYAYGYDDLAYGYEDFAYDQADYAFDIANEYGYDDITHDYGYAFDDYVYDADDYDDDWEEWNDGVWHDPAWHDGAWHADEWQEAHHGYDWQNDHGYDHDWHGGAISGDRVLRQRCADDKPHGSVAPHSQTPSPTSCGTNEERRLGYIPEPTCAILDPYIPIYEAKLGCFCQEGYVRNATGTCTLIWECPQFQEPAEPVCGKNEIYEIGGWPEPSCENLYPIQYEEKFGCFCDDDYVRGKNGSCVLYETCDFTHTHQPVEWASPLDYILRFTRQAETKACEEGKARLQECEVCVCIDGAEKCTVGRTCKPGDPKEPNAPFSCFPGDMDMVEKYSCVCNADRASLACQEAPSCTGKNEAFACKTSELFCDPGTGKATATLATAICEPECYCNEGYARNYLSECVAVASCPQYKLW